MTGAASDDGAKDAADCAKDAADDDGAIDDDVGGGGLPPKKLAIPRCCLASEGAACSLRLPICLLAGALLATVDAGAGNACPHSSHVHAAVLQMRVHAGQARSVVVGMRGRPTTPRVSSGTVNVAVNGKVSSRTCDTPTGISRQ